MPTQKTDDLVQLIRSLTRAEKRHFRLFAKRNQASEKMLFLQLFDYIDKNGRYDEQQLLTKLPAIKKRQLSNLKAHLYKQLLLSLRLLNVPQNEAMQVREMLDYARVLYNKGLYPPSLDMLAKAKNKAYRSQKKALALEIVAFEKLIEGQYITHSSEDRAQALTHETKELLKANKRAHAFSSLSLQLVRVIPTNATWEQIEGL